ncbi:MAG: hypothetical protein AAF609_25810 [Cyanobacteria bacterium P01_C01_bin.120]
MGQSLDDGSSPRTIAAVTTSDGYSWTEAAGVAVAETNTPPLKIASPLRV